MKTFTFIVSLFSIMIAGLALWGVKKNLDTYNITIAVISSLTTILLCWQIYNAIDINSKVKNIELTSRKVARMEIEKYNHTVKSLIMYIEAMDVYKRNNYTEIAVDKLISAIAEGIKGNYVYPVELAINCLYNMTGKDGNLIVMKGKKNEYIKVLSQIYNDRISHIIMNINKALEI